MSLIKQLIDNIYTYGNCKVYFPTNDLNIASVMQFNVSFTGELEITQSLEKFASPIWSEGLEVDDNSYCIGKMNFHKYEKEDLPNVLSTIVYSSFRKQEESDAKIKISAKKRKNIN